MDTNNLTDRLRPLADRARHLSSYELPEGEFNTFLSAVRTQDIYSIPVLEELLANAKAELARILGDDMKCLLAEYGIKAAILEDGSEIEMKTFYETSQKDCDKNQLTAWLESNGYGAIIKDTLALDKGSFDQRLESFLNEHGYSYNRDSNINGQTLKKTISDHAKAGGELPPPEAVKVSIYDAAVIKEPKTPKHF